MIDVRYIQRQDFDLRAKYSFLETIIYRITEYDFEIYVDINDEKVKEIGSDFDHSIRYITSRIKLVNIRPVVYREIVENIHDTEIVRIEEGYAITLHDILKKLSIRFPEISFQRIKGGTDGVPITIFVANYTEVDANVRRYFFLPLPTKARIEAYVLTLNLHAAVELVEVEEDPSKSEANHSVNPILEIVSSRYTNKKIRDLVERDESIYFENIEKIYNGSFTKNDLYYYTESKYSCFFDHSISKNLNIRTLLLLYECIYLVMPIQTNGSDFLNNQKLTREEFYYLVRKGRVKIVMPQPEYRYDINFLSEIKEILPEAIITRRGLATLQQIDIVEMADNFIFNTPETRREIQPLCEAINQQFPGRGNLLFDLLHWPLAAKRQSFYALQTGGVMATSWFGINNVIEKEFSKIINRDLSFDFTINATNIHFAHALNATYFPTILSGGYSDYGFAHVMGLYLNLIKGATTTTLISRQQHDHELEAGVMPIDLIDTFEINTYMPIKDVEKILSSSWVFSKSHSLLSELAPLSKEKREQKVAWYNEKVRQRLKKLHSLKMMIDLGSSASLDYSAVKTNINFLGTIVNIANSALGPVVGGGIRRIRQKLDEALHSPEQQKIHFLSKINRVARLAEKEK